MGNTDTFRKQHTYITNSDSDSISDSGYDSQSNFNSKTDDHSCDDSVPTNSDTYSTDTKTNYSTYGDA